jgi:hypothetical protein
LSKLFKTYFFIKVLYIFFGVYVFSRFSALGDSDRYTSSEADLSLDSLVNRTSLIDLIAGTITRLFTTPLASHFFFCILSFYGLYYCLKRARLNNMAMLGVILMLSLPDFAMWTSISGKESFNVFTTGIIMGGLFDVLYGKKLTNVVLIVLCVILSLIVRPHYSIGLISLFSFVLFTQKVALKAKGMLILNIFIVACFAYIIYIIALPFINEGGFVDIAQAYFIGFDDAGASRNANFWVTNSDYFSKMFSGSWIALIGPTFNESLKRPIYFPFFIESLLFIAYLLYYLVLCIILQVKLKRLSQYFLIMLFYVIVLTAIMHYPFGVFNSGSALRYRSAFFHIYIILPVFMFHYLKARKHAINPV